MFKTLLKLVLAIILTITFLFGAVMIGSLTRALNDISLNLPWVNHRSSTQKSPPNIMPFITESPTPQPFIPFTARFEIVTNGVIRQFSGPMYLGRSPDAYLLAEAPSVIQVTRDGVTWGEFFDSLPFSLSETCLITRDGDQLCKDATHDLRFYLNGNLKDNLLNLPIMASDSARVVFSRIDR